jgi:hypothetical protein
MPTFDINWPTNKVMFTDIAKYHAIKPISLKKKEDVGSFYK